MQLPSLLGHTQELLGIILQSRRPADSLIDTFFRSHKYLGSHDRRFIAETVYGTIRHLRKCEFNLDSILTGFKHKLLEEDRILLLILVYFSLQGKIHEVNSESVCAKLKSNQLKEQWQNLILELSKIITVIPDSFVQRIGIEYSFPDWIVQKFIEQYGGSETEKICSSLNEQAPLTLRVNTLKTNIEQCRAGLSKLGVETAKTSISPFGLNVARRINVFELPIFRDGWFEVQDEGSQLLPLLLDPKPTAKVLDVCAGAGGKTLEFAALMKNRGEIYATDISGFRLDALRKRLRRAGVQNVRILEIQTVEELSEKFKEYFDIVFVDVPCSGLGTIRRNPGMKWTVTEQTVDEVSKKQRTILHSSSPLVKSGGKLVYATCTLLKQENEDIVSQFMEQHKDFTLMETKGSKGWSESVELLEKGYIKLLPHIHGTDGYFCAVLQKQ